MTRFAATHLRPQQHWPDPGREQYAFSGLRCGRRELRHQKPGGHRVPPPAQPLDIRANSDNTSLANRLCPRGPRGVNAAYPGFGCAGATVSEGSSSAAFRFSLTFFLSDTFARRIKTMEEDRRQQRHSEPTATHRSRHAHDRSVHSMPFHRNVRRCVVAANRQAEAGIFTAARIHFFQRLARTASRMRIPVGSSKLLCAPAAIPKVHTKK